MSFLPKNPKIIMKMFFFVNTIIIFCFICWDKNKFVEKKQAFFSTIIIFKLKII